VIVAAVFPLIIILGALVGLALGSLLVRWVQSATVTSEQFEHLRDEDAKRAARKAVDAVVAQLR
jgi:uncharacterized membrane protein